MIEVDKLAKRYSKGGNDAPALSNLSLSVSRGEAVALTGVNGAGKSTLIRILCTLLRPDSGRASIAGLDVVRRASDVRNAIGVALQEASLYPGGRVRDVLELHGRLHGLDRTQSAMRSREVSDVMGLGRVSRKKVRRLSGGMRRRLDLGLALLHRPPVLLLDEPTASLDQDARAAFWNELSRLRGAGTSILLATQDTREIKRVADRVLVLAAGAVLSEGAPAAPGREPSGGLRVV